MRYKKCDIVKKRLVTLYIRLFRVAGLIQCCQFNVFIFGIPAFTISLLQVFQYTFQ